MIHLKKTCGRCVCCSLDCREQMDDVVNVTTKKIAEKAQQKRPASTDFDTDSDTEKRKSSKKQKNPSTTTAKRKTKKAFLDDWSDGDTKSIDATGYRNGGTWKITDGASGRSPAG